jgi:hypothetical protein
VIDRPDIVFTHKHPVFGTANWDEAYLQANHHTQYARGREVFERRKALGFPYVEGIPGWLHPMDQTMPSMRCEVR